MEMIQNKRYAKIKDIAIDLKTNQRKTCKTNSCRDFINKGHCRCFDKCYFAHKNH